ncbi:ABC transporter permease YtrF [Burkholderiales bacterium]|nr:ABC transporter permease YtrF [Burkholderiales bacterium]
MTLAGLAFAYARRRPLSTVLVVALAALGVAIATLTLVVSAALERRLASDARGIDLVVGAKGSPLQLVLAGVYHVDVPPGNIPHASLAWLRARPGVAGAWPLALGDSVRGFRIVGTEPALAELYGASLAAGAMFDAPMQAVIGDDVARMTGWAPGAAFAGTHGLAEGGGEHGENAYTVVGVLAPTGRVVDRLVLTPVESVWDVHEHHAGAGRAASPAPPDAQATRRSSADGVHDGHDRDENAGDDADRELTMILVRYASPLAAASLPREINESSALVAASPAFETARLFTVFGVGLDLLRVFAAVLVGAAALLLFVALAQALEERRYDLAILRALGARPRDLVFVLLAESLALAAGGAVLGIVLGHAAVASIGAWLPAAAPLAGAAWRPGAGEAVVVALALAGGILAACWPAWRASRLDVAATLAEG